MVRTKDYVCRLRDREEGEHLLGMLKETDTSEFVRRDRIEARGKRRELCMMLCQPVLGGKDDLGLIVGEEVAHNLRTLSHEESLANTEFLLLQLSDEFDLVLTDGHCLYVLLLPQRAGILLIYTEFQCKDTNFSAIIYAICSFFCNFAVANHTGR